MQCRRMGKLFFYLITLFLICEYFIYYIVILQCAWPKLSTSEHNRSLKVVIIADTHLLGIRNGHWFDKLRREWQMYRSFQTMVWSLNPDLVFFLGDLFDEGLWGNDEIFDGYVKRFRSLFTVPPTTIVHVVAGNHDIGFHYSIKPSLLKRFVEAFNSRPVDLVNVEGNVFVLVNSMAMEGDGCFLCSQAEKKLNLISSELSCDKEAPKSSSICSTFPNRSRPILLQHFPLYRISDEACEGPDVAPPNLKYIQFGEAFDCLSKQSTEFLFNKLNPRLAFSGHVHYACKVLHRKDIIEYTLPSFSWRNINNPSFMMLHVTPENYAIDKCFLPMESTVIRLYITGIFGPIVIVLSIKVIAVINTYLNFRLPKPVKTKSISI